jgi:hypothetical protein
MFFKNMAYDCGGFKYGLWFVFRVEDIVMSKYGKNGTAWNKAVSIKPMEIVDKIVIDTDFRSDLSELDREIFKLECSIRASMNTKIKGHYYGKKRGIVRTGRKELWWHEQGAFGHGVSGVEEKRRELIKLIALKIG